MRILVVTQHFWPENFRINDIVEGFVQDGLSVDVLCGLPNYPKGEWFDGYSADGPFEEVYKGARVFRAREIPRKGNTGKTIFLNYVSWPLYAAGALKRLPGGYDAVFCFNTWLECSNHTTHFSNFMSNIQPKSNFILPKIGIYFGYAKHLFDSAGLSIIFWHNSILFLKCSRKVAGLCITHKNRYLPNVHIALQ